MKLSWAEQAWEDYLYWQKTDQKILRRINRIVLETKRNPFKGIGDPEPPPFFKNIQQDFEVCILNPGPSAV